MSRTSLCIEFFLNLMQCRNCTINLPDCVVHAQTHADRCIWRQVTVQYLRAVMACANRNSLAIEKCRNVVGMNARNREAKNRNASLRCRRPKQRETRNNFEAFQHVRREFTLVFLNGVKADTLDERDRSTQADHFGNRLRAPLEFCWERRVSCFFSRDLFDHVPPKYEWRQALQ